MRSGSRSLRRRVTPYAGVILPLFAGLWLSGCSPSPHPTRDFQRAITMDEALVAPDKVRVLDLYYRRLPAFPQDILKLRNLEVLVLRTCHLGTLPDDLANLTRLKSLDLGETELTTLTPSVLKLASLTKLWLNDNVLTSLPPGFSHLSNLVYLNLDRNQITELPEDFGSMHSLKWLRLNHNRLTRLPHDLSGLAENLETLYLMGNRIPHEERTRIRDALPRCKVIFE